MYIPLNIPLNEFTGMLDCSAQFSQGLQRGWTTDQETSSKGLNTITAGMQSTLMDTGIWWTPTGQQDISSLRKICQKTW